MTSSLLGWGKGLWLKSQTRGRSLCSASASSFFAHPVGMGTAAFVPRGDRASGQPELPCLTHSISHAEKCPEKEKNPFSCPISVPGAGGGCPGRGAMGAWPQSASTLPFSREKMTFVLIQEVKWESQVLILGWFLS